MEKKKRFEFDLGCIKVNKTLYKPTQDRFCEWLIRYSQLDTHPFRGYLVGGFPSKFDTCDADVCLTNTGSEPADLVKLEWVLFNATKMALEEQSIFVDICWQNYIPDFSADDRIHTVTKYVLTNKIKRDGEVVTDWSDGERIGRNLWKIERTIPNLKQLKKKDKYVSPVDLKQLNTRLWKTNEGGERLRRVL